MERNIVCETSHLKNQEMREFSYLHLAFPPAWGRRSGAGQDLSPSPGSSPSSWRSTCTSTLIVRVMVYTVHCMLYRIHYAIPHESKTKKAPYRQTSSMRHPSGYPVGWVNLYQKFEIEKYTVCGKLILPKKWKGKFFWHNWLANLHGFANICKLPVSNTFKDMQ